MYSTLSPQQCCHRGQLVSVKLLSLSACSAVAYKPYSFTVPRTIGTRTLYRNYGTSNEADGRARFFPTHVLKGNFCLGGVLCAPGTWRGADS